MQMPEGVIGIVLAGGKSNRMGGSDKALLPLAGRPLIAHVIERLRPQVAEIVLNANDDPVRFAPFNLQLAPDHLTGHMGPLIHAGLAWAKAHRQENRFASRLPPTRPTFPIL